MAREPAVQCSTCSIFHPALMDCRTALKATIADILLRIGRPSKCSCGQALIDVRYAGKNTTAHYEITGRLHGNLCPFAFRRDDDPAPAAACDLCNLRHDTADDCVTALKNAIRYLLLQAGEPARCSGCGIEIVWLIHTNTKRAPYTIHGFNHFADCPLRDRFRTTYAKR